MKKTNNIRKRCFEVDQNFDGFRLDKFLVHCIPRLSRSKASEIAKFGDVTISRLKSEKAQKIKPSTKLLFGDIVTLKEYLPEEEVIHDQVGICFEDEDIIALNKPPGMLVHEAGKIRQNTLVEYLRRKGYENAGPAHRIDRETSGIVLCGKSKIWISKLQKAFEEKRPLKIYRALVRDPQNQLRLGEERTFDQSLGLLPHSASGVIMGSGPLFSKTHIRVLSSVQIKNTPCKDLEVRIETGRQHQIRVHLAMFGTPIVGDKLYGFGEHAYVKYLDEEEDPFEGRLLHERHALHAWKLELNLSGKEKLTLIASLPEELWEPKIG